MLVVLRVAVGWHFLYQGIWKLNEPDFTSEGFLRQAKGPMAETFYEMVPDYEGRDRLDYEQTLERWQALHAEAIEKYGLDDAQKAELQRRFDQREWQLKDYLVESVIGGKKLPGVITEELEKNLHEWERLAAAEDEPGATDVPFKQRRNWDKRKKLEGEARPWLTHVAAIEADLLADVDSVLSDEQQDQGKIAGEKKSLAGFDMFLIASLIAIGVCLTGGLFTRLAAIGGACFLLGVVMSQPPWPAIYPPPPPAVGPALIVNKEVIEMVALLALAALPVGRWGGLDFYIHHWLFSRRNGKPGAGKQGERS